uniref:Uncharacterized protein n=1 Tax=Avena sativa TaxID=4498 RepID=A0ACD5WZ18_AVESA
MAASARGWRHRLGHPAAPDQGLPKSTAARGEEGPRPPLQDAGEGSPPPPAPAGLRPTTQAGGGEGWRKVEGAGVAGGRGGVSSPSGERETRAPLYISLPFPCTSSSSIASHPRFLRSTTMSQLPPPPSPTMAQPPLDKGKKRRTEIRLVKKKTTRQMTFSKRKGGLYNKVAELAVLCRARIAIVVFSESGKAFAIGSPSVDAVLALLDDDAPVPAAANDEAEWKAMEALSLEVDKKGAEAKAKAARMTAIGKKVLELQEQTGKSFWWEVDPEALGPEEELPLFLKTIERLMANLACRIHNQLTDQ